MLTKNTHTHTQTTPHTTCTPALKNVGEKSENISQRAFPIECETFLRSKFLEFAPLSIAQIQNLKIGVTVRFSDIRICPDTHTHRQTDRQNQNTHPRREQNMRAYSFFSRAFGITDPHSNKRRYFHTKISDTF